MRVRTIMTVAILSAGCGTSGTTRQDRAGTPAVAAPAPSTIAAAAPPAAAAAPATSPTSVIAVAAPVTASSAPAPRPAAPSRQQLELLASELRSTEPTQVATRVAHFRPLCDAEGYPLVGNLAMKSARPPTPVADFCASVRSGSAR
jgi:hypothetical protein